MQKLSVCASSTSRRGVLVCLDIEEVRMLGFTFHKLKIKRLIIIQLQN